MGFNLSGGYAAGGGADALETLLKQAFIQQAEKRRAGQEDRRIAISQQNADDNSALRKIAQADRADASAASQKLQAQTGALKTAGTLRIGQELTPQTQATLAGGGLGETVKAPTLGSRNIGAGMASAPNPGKGASYLGTADQQDEAAQNTELQRQIAIAPPALRGRLLMASLLSPDKRAGAISEVMREEAKPTAQPVMRVNPRSGKMEQIGEAPQGAHFVNEPAPPQAPVVMVQTVDENGNPVTRMVKKEAGAEYVKPANATTATRTASAEVVNQVGNDIIKKLSDPAFKAAVGPLMGRAGTLRDFLGNPPPEFSELAGQIESYALANMGVHGMRSAQGAEAIKKLLDQRHTPESLAATIRGLNDFSTRFVAGNKPKSGAATTPAKSSGFSVVEVK